MRFVVTADIHLHPYRQCSHDSGQDRLIDGLSALNQTLIAARQRECSWIFLGDLKHLRGVWHQTALNQARQIFKNFMDVPKVMIHGNHDGMGGGSGLLPFQDEMTLVVTEPRLVSGPFEDYIDEPVTVWPWQPDLAGLPELIKEAKDWKSNVFLGHLFLKNSVVGNKDVPIMKGATLDDIGMGNKPRFKWAFVGDVHKAQLVPGCQNGAPVMYPGSPLALNWGEQETDKGCVYVDTKKGYVEPIRVLGPSFRVAEIGNLIEPLSEYEGDFVRLYLDKSDAKKIDKIRDAMRPRWIEAIIRREKTDPTVRSHIHAGMTPRQIIEEYVGVRPPEFAEGTKERTTAVLVGLKLMEGD